MQTQVRRNGTQVRRTLRDVARAIRTECGCTFPLTASNVALQQYIDDHTHLLDNTVVGGAPKRNRCGGPRTSTPPAKQARTKQLRRYCDVVDIMVRMLDLFYTHWKREEDVTTFLHPSSVSIDLENWTVVHGDRLLVQHPSTVAYKKEITEKKIDTYMNQRLYDVHAICTTVHDMLSKINTKFSIPAVETQLTDMYSPLREELNRLSPELLVTLKAYQDHCLSTRHETYKHVKKILSTFKGTFYVESPLESSTRERTTIAFTDIDQHTALALEHFAIVNNTAVATDMDVSKDTTTQMDGTSDDDGTDISEDTDEKEDDEVDEDTTRMTHIVTRVWQDVEKGDEEKKRKWNSVLETAEIVIEYFDGFKRNVHTPKMVARLKSITANPQYIPAIYDVGLVFRTEKNTNTGGLFYVARKYETEFQTLHDALKEGERASDFIVLLVESLIEALGATFWANKIAHGDLKPENILVSKYPWRNKPKIKLIDFITSQDTLGHHGDVSYTYAVQESEEIQPLSHDVLACANVIVEILRACDNHAHLDKLYQFCNEATVRAHNAQHKCAYFAEKVRSLCRPGNIIPVSHMASNNSHNPELWLAAMEYLSQRDRARLSAVSRDVHNYVNNVEISTIHFKMPIFHEYLLRHLEHNSVDPSLRSRARVVLKVDRLILVTQQFRTSWDAIMSEIKQRLVKSRFSECIIVSRTEKKIPPSFTPRYLFRGKNRGRNVKTALWQWSRTGEVKKPSGSRGVLR